MIKISPSILSADFSELRTEIQSLEEGGADLIHVDVMDGCFVPNISIGFPVLACLKNITSIPLDIHLMIHKPHRYVKRFLDAGAEILTFHLEADEPQDILEAIAFIRKSGRKAGLSLKPQTPAECILPYLPLLDLVLVMTVEPGFGGQAFLTGQLEKIRMIRRMIIRTNPACALEVDGGITPETARLCIKAGADILVAGSDIFSQEDRTARILSLRGDSSTNLKSNNKESR